MAGLRGVEVFTAFCESHTSQVPFHAVAPAAGARPPASRGLTRRPPAPGYGLGLLTPRLKDLLLFDDLLV